MTSPPQITSLQNPRVKETVKLRKRSVRDERDLFLVEGYRELRRALDNGWIPRQLFYCPELFLGEHEESVVSRCEAAGVEAFACSAPVFRKLAYRERPEGLLAVGRQRHRTLAELRPGPAPLLLVAEAIEKPGNLGTILRSADAAGVDAVIVCDRCTDIHNPNVVRSSIGTLFALPVVEAGSDEAVRWLDESGIRIVAATPHATRIYTEVDLTGPAALVMGTEQYGLTETWLTWAAEQVRIPMLGQADSLNVAAAATILLYEAVRQRAAGAASA